MLQPHLLSQTSIYSQEENNTSAMPLYQEFIQQMQSLNREKSEVASKESLTSGAQNPAQPGYAAANFNEKIDLHSGTSIYKTQQQQEKPQAFSQPYSFEEAPASTEDHFLNHNQAMQNPSCTSVDALIRQRLTGVTVSSSHPTAGPSSMITSKEHLSKGGEFIKVGDQLEEAERHHQSSTLNKSSSTGSDVYSLEVLKEKHAKLKQEVIQLKRDPSTSTCAGGGLDHQTNGGAQSTSASVFKPTQATNSVTGYGIHQKSGSTTQFDNLTGLQDVRGLLFDASHDKYNYQSQASQPDVVTLRPPYRQDPGQSAEYNLQSSTKLRQNESRENYDNSEQTSGLSIQKHLAAEAKHVQSYPDSQPEEIVTLSNLGRTNALSNDSMASSFGVRIPSIVNHTSAQPVASLPNSSQNYNQAKIAQNAAINLSSNSGKPDTYQFKRVKQLLEDNNRIVGSLRGTGTSTATLGGRNGASKGANPYEYTNDFGRYANYDNNVGSRNTSGVMDDSHCKEGSMKQETLNRDLNSQMSSKQILNANASNIVWSNITKFDFEKEHDTSSKQGDDSMAKLVGYEAQSTNKGFQFGEAVYSLQTEKDQNKDHLGYSRVPVLRNDRTEPKLIDTQGENEIASNLAKLKQDLKTQAEAITELRKQAWENTGSTVVSNTQKVTAPSTRTQLTTQGNNTLFSQQTNFGHMSQPTRSDLPPVYSGRTEETTSFVHVSNLNEAIKAESVLPAHEVTAMSLDLFNYVQRDGSQGRVDSMSMEQTEYEQLMDFHKRMDKFQKDRTDTSDKIGAAQESNHRKVTKNTQNGAVTEKFSSYHNQHQSPSNLSYQRKEVSPSNKNEVTRASKRDERRKPSKELRAQSTLSFADQKERSTSQCQSESQQDVRKELTPNVIANSRREFRQFELAYNREEISKRKSQERRSSLQLSRPISKHSKQERMIDVYANGAVNLGPMTERSRKAKSANSTKRDRDVSQTNKSSRKGKSLNNRSKSLRNPFSSKLQPKTLKRAKKLKRKRSPMRARSVGSGGVSSKLQKAMQGPQAHRHRSQNRLLKAFDAQMAIEAPRLILSRIKSHVQAKSTRSVRTRSKSIPNRSLPRIPATACRPPFMNMTEASRSRSRSHSKTNTNKTKKRKENVLSIKKGRPRSRSSRSQRKNDSYLATSTSAIVHRHLVNKRQQVEEPLYQLPQNDYQGTNNPYKRNNSRSRSRSNPHLKHQQVYSGVADQSSRLMNPFTRYNMDTTNKSLFSHRTASHGDSPNGATQYSMGNGTAAINIVGSQAFQLSSNTSRQETPSQSKKAKKPIKSSQKSKRKCAAPRPKSTIQTQQFSYQNGNGRNVNQTSSYQQYSQNKLSNLTSVQKQQRTSSSRLNSNLVSARAGPHGASNKSLRSAKGGEQSQRNSRRENAQPPASEQKKVKALYSQLQEKSTELTDLLSRIKAIID